MLDNWSVTVRRYKEQRERDARQQKIAMQVFAAVTLGFILIYVAYGV